MSKDSMKNTNWEPQIKESLRKAPLAKEIQRQINDEAAKRGIDDVPYTAGNTDGPGSSDG